MTSTGLRLVVFDVDGTLVDSQNDIVNAMVTAYGLSDIPPPERSAILSIVGLSLDAAMARLSPDLSQEMRDKLVADYKSTYNKNRTDHGAGAAPLYPNARKTLDTLAGMSNVLLGVATGKSKRGLDALLEAHDLAQYFVTQQVADHHPSKPHPSMLFAALAETGCNVSNATMVGDTEFDMQMARSAGFGSIGVSWGYHPVSLLGDADAIIHGFDELPELLTLKWGN